MLKILNEFPALVLSKEGGRGQMLETGINFPREEKETLKEIRIMPEQVIKKLEYLKTCKTA